MLVLVSQKGIWSYLTGKDDDENQSCNSSDNPHPHLDVLPAHVFPDTVGAASEAISMVFQVVGLVLQNIEVLSTLGKILDVGLHDSGGGIELL